MSGTHGQPPRLAQIRSSGKSMATSVEVARMAEVVGPVVGVVHGAVDLHRQVQPRRTWRRAGSNAGRWPAARCSARSRGSRWRRPRAPAARASRTPRMPSIGSIRANIRKRPGCLRWISPISLFSMLHRKPYSMPARSMSATIAMNCRSRSVRREALGRGPGRAAAEDGAVVGEAVAPGRSSGPPVGVPGRPLPDLPGRAGAASDSGASISMSMMRCMLFPFERSRRGCPESTWPGNLPGGRLGQPTESCRLLLAGGPSGAVRLGTDWMTAP